jgi:hypothetical protein
VQATKEAKSTMNEER